ncbi:MAG: hypothetical protein ACOCQR_02415 [bacterium]
MSQVFKKTTNSLHYDTLLNSSEYNDETRKIIHISPEDYFRCCAKINERSIIAEIFSVDDFERGRINRILEDILEKGEKMPIPVLDYNENKIRGRLEVIVSDILGLEIIPVLVVRDKKSN